MFESLLEKLVESGYGVRAYEECSRDARGRISKEPENAAALLLISYAAQRFVDAYDDQPLPVDVANAELAQFSTMVKSLEAAFASGEPNKKLDQLNLTAGKLLGAPKA